MIKAVIFDMDGVLIDAKEWHYEALNKALDLFGVNISRVEHLNTYDGLPTKKKLQLLSSEKSLPVGLHQFINDMKQIYTMEYVATKCKPRFEHEYALSRLKREGFKLAVASNSIRKTITSMMENASLISYLDFYLSNQDVTKGKPDPEIYLKAIDQLKLSPQECLIVEDNENGKKAARASGAHLLEVEDVHEVTYSCISSTITSIQNT